MIFAFIARGIIFPPLQADILAVYLVEGLLARKKRDRREQRPERQESVADRARNELFSAIRQCGVIDAAEDDQVEWMDDTIRFLAERYPELTPEELEQLKLTGLRFCQPVIPHGSQNKSADDLEDANAA
jgi:hypothetical protein